MRKTVIGLTLSALLFALCSVAEAQQSAKVPRIGYLTGTSLSAIAHRVEAFRQGLRELGYIEGKNIVIEYRSAEGTIDRLPDLAAEFVHLQVDVVVTTGASVTRLAKQATNSIPIVMTQANDPVGSGFIASLARPGGNVTGLSSSGPEVSGKRLEILKELVLRVSRVAALGTSTDPANPQDLKETELAARALGVKLEYIDVVDSRDIEPAFKEVTKRRADALLMMMAGPVANPHRKKIAELAVKSRVPAIYTLADYVEAGGLMAYGVVITDLDRRAATYVDKILKGAKPSNLPVEQPTKFELVINLKAAKQIGLTIPPSVLARADRVIK